MNPNQTTLAWVHVPPTRYILGESTWQAGSDDGPRYIVRQDGPHSFSWWALFIPGCGYDDGEVNIPTLKQAQEACEAFARGEYPEKDRKYEPFWRATRQYALGIAIDPDGAWTKECAA